MLSKRKEYNGIDALDFSYREDAGFKDFDRESFGDMALRAGSVYFKEKAGKLHSGIMSRLYFNGRVFGSDIELSEGLSAHILRFLRDVDIEPDSLVGVPEGTNGFMPILIQAARKEYGKGFSTVMLRKEPKEYGDPRDKYLSSGNIEKGSNVLLIEDAATTGDSLEKYHAIIIQEFESNVPYSVCLFNRLERTRSKYDFEFPFGVKTKFGFMGTEHHSMLTAQDIVPIAFDVLINPRTPEELELAYQIEQKYIENDIKEFVVKPGFEFAKELAQHVDREYEEHGILGVNMRLTERLMASRKGS